jgi:DNA processing protein
VESSADVLEELRWEAPSPGVVHQESSRAPQDPLLDAMGFDPVDPETLSGRLVWRIEDVTTRILELELAGCLARLPGGRVQRRR